MGGCAFRYCGVFESTMKWRCRRQWQWQRPTVLLVVRPLWHEFMGSAVGPGNKCRKDLPRWCGHKCALLCREWFQSAGASHDHDHHQEGLCVGKHGRYAGLVALNCGGARPDRGGDDARPSGGGMRGGNYEVSVPLNWVLSPLSMRRTHKLTISFAPDWFLPERRRSFAGGNRKRWPRWRTRYDSSRSSRRRRASNWMQRATFAWKPSLRTVSDIYAIIARYDVAPDAAEKLRWEVIK